MGSITDRALRAAQAVADDDGMPSADSASWERFEERATQKLTQILGDDPGPCQRLEPGDRSAHQYPPEVRNARMLVFYPDGHEVVVEGKMRRSFVVRRASNPNEEAMLSRFRNIAEFGEAIR